VNSITTPGGVAVRWSGCELNNDGYMLDGGTGTRLGLDGQVHRLEAGCVTISKEGRFGTGAFAFQVLDTVTGFSIACRGMELPTPYQELDTKSVVGVQIGGIDVLFGRGLARSGPGRYDAELDRTVRFMPQDWLATTGPLTTGEITLRAVRAKSLPRRVRKFQMAGALEGRRGDGKSNGLLLLKSESPAEWPPPVRVRKRARAGEGENNRSHRRY